MKRNVEIKATVADVEGLTAKAKLLSNSEGRTLVQTDTYYATSEGKMKLRIIEGQGSELIYYVRAHEDGPKMSMYERIEGHEATRFGSILERAIGIIGKVKKTRNLFLVGQTRIHIDTVENLGNFMELEVVLSENQSQEEGTAIAHSLMGKLGIRNEDLLCGSYIDLLLEKSRMQVQSVNNEN